MAQSIVQISPEVIAELQKQIEDNFVQPQGADEIRQGFCNSWPAARAGLEALRTVLNFVPGVSMFAGPAISVVVAAGDAAKNGLCKGS